jgi:hypothetical protein
MYLSTCHCCVVGCAKENMTIWGQLADSDSKRDKLKKEPNSRLSVGAAAALPIVEATIALALVKASISVLNPDHSSHINSQLQRVTVGLAKRMVACTCTAADVPLQMKRRRSRLQRLDFVDWTNAYHKHHNAQRAAKTRTTTLDKPLREGG